MTTVTGAFGNGLTTPVWVLQHLLGILGIGLWAGQAGGTAVWQVPAAAVTAALAAGFAAQMGLRLPYAGPGLAASLVVIGSLVALGVRAPAVLAVLVAAVAAVFHGHTHQGPPLYWAGFAAGLMLVACGGLGLSIAVTQAESDRAVRVCGGAVAVAGVLDLVGVI
ncbi:HupE/UreJ family protein [Azospirillum sp.]|uniref:HupE/UreJ family protein n=1 Tax=Azospirillum sp. TaxID=34012 RepID=UPI002D5275E9|nr:HupE/UreJ family protein [Azospirillum sp.]HYF87816.1 HupE/UreJ family protein [Azospirillum sp.]